MSFDNIMNSQIMHKGATIFAKEQRFYRHNAKR